MDGIAWWQSTILGPVHACNRQQVSIRRDSGYLDYPIFRQGQADDFLPGCRLRHIATAIAQPTIFGGSGLQSAPRKAAHRVPAFPFSPPPPPPPPPPATPSP